VLLGQATALTDPDEKRRALECLIEKLHPGRWSEIRRPSSHELRATSVLGIPISEASAKIRRGPPIDDHGDLGRAVWAGVIPVALRRGRPERAPDMPAGAPEPQPA
jgi:hypothetical protein